MFAILCASLQTGPVDAYIPYNASTNRSTPDTANDFSAHLTRSTQPESANRAQRATRPDAARGRDIPDQPNRAVPRREMPGSGEQSAPNLGVRLDDDAPARDLDEPPEDLIASALFTPAVNRPDDTTPEDSAQQPEDPDAALAAALVSAQGIDEAAPTTAQPPSPDAVEPAAIPDVPIDDLLAQELAANPEAPIDPAAIAPEPQQAQEVPANLDADIRPFAHLIRKIHVAAQEEGARPAEPAAATADPASLDSPLEAAPPLTTEATAEEPSLAGQNDSPATGGDAADAELPLDAAALSGTTQLTAPELAIDESPTAQVPSVSNQIAEKIQTGIGQGQNQCEIQLLPEHLGRVTVRLAMTEQGLSATIRAENVAARNLIHDGLQQLQDTLERAGIRVHEVDVTGEAMTQLGSEAFQGNGQRGDSPSGGHRASGVRLRAAATMQQLDERYAPSGEQQLTLTGIEEVQGYQVLA